MYEIIVNVKTLSNAAYMLLQYTYINKVSIAFIQIEFILDYRNYRPPLM